MKKFLSVLLAVLAVFSCFTVAVSAEDAAEPVKTDSGYYIGQRFKPGDKITSVHKTCEMLTVSYSVSRDDVEKVTSAQQKKYADEKFSGVVSFRDSIASFSSGEEYAGVYTLKGVGDEVNEMETENGTFKTGLDIYNSMSKDEKKKIKGELVLSIDYAYEKTTFYQYTTLTYWEVLNVTETENALTVRLQAVYETREPNGFESFVEKLYVKWLAFLDVLGDHYIRTLPKVIDLLAKLLGNR